MSEQFPKRVLLIDDSELVIEAVRDALEPDGVSVAALGDLTDLERARALLDFDLVLLDIQLPEVLVDQVAVLLRRRSRLTAPIVLLSSLPEAELADRARASRYDGYILKDHGIDGLTEEIRDWLGGRGKRCEGCGYDVSVTGG
jgi:CheY-like chemotaxis protein